MPIDTTTASDVSDEAKIYSFSVGHGDCTLLEFSQGGILRFRLLVDAGLTLPAALIKHLRTHPRDDSDFDLDVLVLSHVDADHQGGLPTLLKEKIRVKEYLGPCLPTFRRLSWLFAPRVQAAISRAEEFEAQLRGKCVPVWYPLEGYSNRYVGGRVTLTVLSPAARLVERLSLASGGELSNLLMRSPLPLQWLIEAGPAENREGLESLKMRFKSRGMLGPDDFPNALPNALGINPEDIHAAASIHQEQFDPEFFGNSVLNDTSLVLAVDFVLDGTHRRRVLLTGDQENWSYIAAMHPGGLGVDVLKAPHHGWRLYLEDKSEALDQVYVWLRPRSVFVSANGLHGLPRAEFRDALLTIGATLLCPNMRSIEPLTAGARLAPAAKSCFGAFGCTPGHNVTAISLTANGETANALACTQGSGHRGTAPIVVLRQHIVAPSEAFVRWTRAELTKHANWIRVQLEAIHDQFVEMPASASISKTIAQLPTAWPILAARASYACRHDLVVDPDPVLRLGLLNECFGFHPKHTAQITQRFIGFQTLQSFVTSLNGFARFQTSLGRSP